MTGDQIKHMVNRFLGWHLPKNFAPDAGISYTPFGRYSMPFGTNLLDATQADAMVRYMVEGMPDASKPFGDRKPTVAELEAILSPTSN